MRLFTRAGRRSIIVAVSILGLAAVTGVVSIAAAGTHQARAASADSSGHWVGTWGASAQPATPSSLAGPGDQSAAGFNNQTVRNIVFTSAGGSQVQVRVSNVFSDQPLVVDGSTSPSRRAERVWNRAPITS